jgi:hypothetical protein
MLRACEQIKESVRGMLEVMAGATPVEHNGKFLEYDGAVLPW